MDAVKKYHEITKEYRQSLKTAWDAYGKGYERLQGYKGSERYDKELTELQDERDAAIKAAREKAGGRYDTVLRYMRKAIDAQPAKAPTDEQMRIVNAFKMREHVEADELVKAAEQMRGVDMAVKVLDEVAKANGYHNRLDEYMGATGRASAAVDRLTSSAKHILTITRTDAAKKRHEAHHVMKWGGEWDERHEGMGIDRDPAADYALNPIDHDYTNERDTACELGGVEGFYSEFRSTVNYDPGAKPGMQKLWGEV